MGNKVFFNVSVPRKSNMSDEEKEKFIAVTRNWGKRQRGCSATGQRDLKNHPYTEKEQAIHTKFTAVAAATRLRMADPSKMADDSEAFRAQTEFKTLYRFLFNLEWKAYVAE